MLEIDGSDKLDFSGLILAFSSAALYYIGHSTIEEKSIKQVNLPLALQNIDIISMLKEKTAGNLTQPEQELISRVLKDLEVKYASVSAEK